MLPPMYISLISNTQESRNLYMATSNTPQRGSAPPFSTSENDALYTLPTYTVGRFTDQGRQEQLEIIHLKEGLPLHLALQRMTHSTRCPHTQ